MNNPGRHLLECDEDGAFLGFEYPKIRKSMRRSGKKRIQEGIRQRATCYRT